MLRGRRRGLPATFLLLAALMAGCGRSVYVEPLPADPVSEAACQAVVDALPGATAAGRAWSVEPDPDSTAAWGSPPVVLRCGDGLAPPQPTDQVIIVDDVSWVVATLTDGEEYRTADRVPGVVVTVPSQYAPTVAVIAEVTPAVRVGTDAVG